MKLPIQRGIAFATLFLAPVAGAHPGHAGGSSGLAGFTHPLGGCDHVLAMVAVGLWAAQLGGRARWIVPAAFLSAMSLGGVLAAAGIPLAAAQEGIFASVLLLGILITVAARVALPLAAFTVGAFALFHGFAHVAEIRPGDNLPAYAAGFLCATALLHTAGLALGALIRKSHRPSLLRICGGVLTLAAITLWIGAQ